MVKTCIVIPVHSSVPTTEELFAFAQCFKILSDHSIYVVCPEGLDLSAYKKVYKEIKTVTIAPDWLSSVENYNRFKCSLFFYSLFSDYEFLLTYELDAFVFKDELLDWCDKGYSYIGAPWFEGYSAPKIPYEITGIGNSGFSLRNIDSCNSVINRIKTLKKISNIYTNLKIGKIYAFTSFIKKTRLSQLFKIRDTTYLPDLLSGNFINEDIFWSEWVAITFTDFKLAPVVDAQKFSFEVNPRWLFEKNNSKLPFGCHAWMKYDPEFWKNHIQLSHSID